MTLVIFEIANEPLLTDCKFLEMRRIMISIIPRVHLYPGRVKWEGSTEVGVGHKHRGSHPSHLEHMHEHCVCLCVCLRLP